MWLRFKHASHEEPMKPGPTQARRITHHGATGPSAMSIQQYVELVDRLLEKEEYAPEVKKPPQPAR
jgi:hypothetical protein